MIYILIDNLAILFLQSLQSLQSLLFFSVTPVALISIPAAVRIRCTDIYLVAPIFLLFGFSTSLF